MLIVRAEAGDADQLSHIARTAKAHWGYPTHWMAAWQGLFTIRPEQITANDYFVARIGEELPVGFSGVHREGDSWRLEHLWLLPEWHGHDVGRQLFESATALIHSQGGGVLLIRADPNAEGFYLRMGAVRVGEVDATLFGVPRALPELRYAID